MADKTIPNLTELAEAPAAGDKFYVVDVSDTTDSAAGTSKFILKSNLISGSGISNVVEDTTPQLGGDLDMNGNQITSPDGTDLINIPNGSIDLQTASTSRLDITDSGVRLGAANARVTTVLDEDAMGSDSATALATQQSIKAYADLKAPIASPTFTGTVTLPTGLTGVIRADSGVVSTDSDVTDLVTAASDSAAGKVELATTAETNTGTDTGRAVTPDGLAGSVLGTKIVEMVCFDWTTNTATGDGKFYFHVPLSLNGFNIVTVHARVITAGTTNTTDIQLHNLTAAADILSTKLTIDSGETGSDTAATPAVINASEDDLTTNDVIRVDVDAVSTTPAKGLIVSLECRLP